jgi:hypothetical protein
MKLELNIKEWLALYGLLERQAASPDKHLTEVQNRMKATLVSALTTLDREPFERWFDATQRKIDVLEQENTGVKQSMAAPVLTDDDNEFVVEPTADEQYPKKQPGSTGVSFHRRKHRRKG